MAPELQLVVGKHRPELLRLFREAFSREESAGEIEITVDRRLRDRRERTQAPSPEMRRRVRRQSKIAHALNAGGWAFVKR